MSSILDALKKLEADKAREAERAASEESPPPFEADTAAEELLGHRPKRRAARTGPPYVLIGAALAGIAVVVVSASAGITLALLRNQEPAPGAPGRLALDAAPPAATAAAPAAPETAVPDPAIPPAAPEPAASAEATAVVENAPVVQRLPEPAPAAESPQPPPSPPPAAPDPAPAQTQPAPEPAQDATRLAAARTEDPILAPPRPEIQDPPPPPPSPSETAAEAPRRSGAAARPYWGFTPDDDLAVPASPFARPPANAEPQAAQREPQPPPADPEALPPLRGADKTRHNIENIRINVLRAPDDGNPYAHAVINLHKVFVGERIPGTSVKLLSVTGSGVALEVIGSGERYFLRR